MAKDLTSFKITPEGASASATHLASVSKDGDTHLAVIRLTSKWTDKQFVLTPDQEGYSCAVVSAYSSNYNVSHDTPSHTAALYNDGQDLLAQSDAIWNSKTTSSWISGHKAICQYFSRGRGPWTAFVRKPSNPERYIEQGATRVALNFNAHAFPLAKCSAFSAKLRVWCPSVLYESDNSAPSASSALHNDSQCLWAVFSSDLPAPSAISADTHASFDIGPLANRGATTATAVYSEDYDIWNSGTLASELPVYKGSASSHSTKSTAYYYSDAVISGDALNSLKAAMNKGPFWLVAGFKPANGFGSFINNTYSAMGISFRGVSYASRFELVFTASANPFN